MLSLLYYLYSKYFSLTNIKNISIEISDIETTVLEHLSLSNYRNTVW